MTEFPEQVLSIELHESNLFICWEILEAFIFIYMLV